MKVGTHEKSYRTFVGNAIYVSVPGLIDPRVMFRQKKFLFDQIDAARSQEVLQKKCDFDVSILAHARI